MTRKHMRVMAMPCRGVCRRVVQRQDHDAPLPLVALLFVGMCLRESSSFTMSPSFRRASTSAFHAPKSSTARFLFEEKASFHRRDEEPDDGDALTKNNNNNNNNNSDGPNWIERSFVVSATDEEIKASTVLDYNLGISGTSYQTGPLASRMYQAMTARSSILQQQQDDDDNDDQVEELRRTFQMIAMDSAAKEAVRAALLENGLELALPEGDEQVGEWGMVDSIRLFDDDNNAGSSNNQIYDDWDEAVDHWTPGQGFDFVVRQVPAKMRALSLEELLQALDPKGELRQQAKEAGMSLPDISDDHDDDDVDDGEAAPFQTLEEMATENVRRVNAAPREAVLSNDAFAGDLTKRGYRPIHASALASLENDGTLVSSTMMHVMDAFVSHGCLLVDLTDGGTVFDKAKAVARMWVITEKFFEQVDDGKLPDEIQGMKTAAEAGSAHAKVGFASYDGGNIQFLETRLTRSGSMLPSAAEAVLGEAGCQSLMEAFKILTNIAKDISRTVVATCSQEVGALGGRFAVEGGTKLVNELVDDGMPIETDVEYKEGPVSMSPHRLCRYSNDDAKEGSEKSNATREIFGAHTDSTFITAVPVALVPGLEVFDEAAEKWYRPEKAARIHWVNGQKALGRDLSATTETLEDGSVIPWCARYAVMMPGELLQLFSRNEVLAAVHRVVATQEQLSRLSAPVLVRGRPGTTVDIKRYLGKSMDEPILNHCDGRRIEDIYDLMQVQSFQ